MRRILRRGGEEYEIARGSAGQSLRGPADRAAAARFLRTFLADRRNTAILRSLLGEEIPGTCIASLSDLAVVDRLATRVAGGLLRIRRQGQEPPVCSIASEEEKPPAAIAAEMIPKTWIAFQVVEDATGKAVRNVRLKVKLPDGSSREGATDGGGRVEFREIDSGACEVTCDIAQARLSGTFHAVGIGDSRIREDEGLAPAAGIQDCGGAEPCFPVPEEEVPEEESLEWEYEETPEEDLEALPEVTEEAAEPSSDIAAESDSSEVFSELVPEEGLPPPPEQPSVETVPEPEATSPPMQFDEMFPAESPQVSEEEEKPEPAWIATVEEHEVQSGETIEKIAQSSGMSWQQLTEFNWETSKKEEVNDRLLSIVGCVGEATQAQNHVFDDDDDPGIVWAPKEWKVTDLETERTHVIRVERPGTALGILSLVLYDDQWAGSLPDKPYRIEGAKGILFQGRTDAEGALEHGPVPLGYYTLVVEDVMLEPESGEGEPQRSSVTLRVPSVPYGHERWPQRLPFVRREIADNVWIAEGFGSMSGIGIAWNPKESHD